MICTVRLKGGQSIVFRKMTQQGVDSLAQVLLTMPESDVVTLAPSDGTVVYVKTTDASAMEVDQE